MRQATEVDGCDVREPVKELRKVRDGFICYSDGDSETVGDREKLFGDYGERLESEEIAVETFEDALP